MSVGGRVVRAVKALQGRPALRTRSTVGGATSRIQAGAPVDGGASVPSLRTLGTTALKACAGNDARLSDSRVPTGAAGGDLTGTYPNPTLSASARHSLLPISNEASSVSTTVIYGKVGAHTESLTSTENDRKFPAKAGTLKKFYLRIGQAVTAGHTLTVTIRVNGVDTGLTLSFVNADGANAEKSVAADVSVVEGDDLTVSFVKDTIGAQPFNPRGWVSMAVS